LWRRKLIAAILGIGSIGRRHARNLSKLVKKIHAYDPIGSSDLDLACPVVDFADAEEAIKDADLVVISSPHSAHLEQMRLCCKHRKHFLVEKPIASSVFGLDQILIDSQDLVTQVGYNLRFHPTVIAAKRTIDEGEIGKVLHASFEYGSYLPSWRPGKNYKENYAASVVDGGIILDDIHEIDLSCFLLGYPKRIHCVSTNTRSLGITHEDMADMTFTGQPGSHTSVIHMDYLQRIPTRRFKIIGTAGTVECDLNTASLAVKTIDGVRSLRESEYDPNIMYEREISHFVASVRDHTPDPTLTVDVGVRTLRIALLARKAGVLGRSIEL
jgi:predicted dehydrogenase